MKSGPYELGPGDFSTKLWIRDMNDLKISARLSYNKTKNNNAKRSIPASPSCFQAYSMSSLRIFFLGGGLRIFHPIRDSPLCRGGGEQNLRIFDPVSRLIRIYMIFNLKV